MTAYPNLLVRVNPQTLVISGLPLSAPPSPFNGLDLSSLADLGVTFPGQSFAIHGAEINTTGLGFWPITTVDSSAVILGQTVASGSDTFTANAETQTVTQHLGAQAMTSDEIAALASIRYAQGGNAIDDMLDAFAQTWQYKSIESAVTYDNSSNARFKADAAALSAYRDAVWQETIVIQAMPFAQQPTSTAALLALINTACPAPTRPVV